MIRDTVFLNALNTIPGVGAGTLRALKTAFGSYETAWHANGAKLEDAGIRADIREAIEKARPGINPDHAMQAVLRHDIWILTDDDARYPALLQEIPAPPVILYGQGAYPDAWPEVRLGVVGTRRPTSYGLEVARAIAHNVALRNIAIVSGLATGIDAHAHAAALDARGITIAVLGSGIDRDSIFPPENRGLAARIVASGGTVISEYAPGTPATKDHFPARNRIISGLARGVLVVEARERSGALITARYATEQNRDVFAVPGPVYSAASYGPHSLLREGAILARHADDVLAEWAMLSDVSSVSPADTGRLSEEETVLLTHLENPQNVDNLKAGTHMPVGTIIATLSLLDLKGLVCNLGGDTWQKRSS